MILQLKRKIFASSEIAVRVSGGEGIVQKGPVDFGGNMPDRERPLDAGHSVLHRTVSYSGRSGRCTDAGGNI